MRRRTKEERRARARERRLATVVAFVALIVASEILDRDDGSKSLAAWIVSALLAAVIYAAIEWSRRDPGREHPGSPDGSVR